MRFALISCLDEQKKGTQNYLLMSF